MFAHRTRLVWGRAKSPGTALSHASQIAVLRALETLEQILELRLELQTRALAVPGSASRSSCLAGTSC